MNTLPSRKPGRAPPPAILPSWRCLPTLRPAGMLCKAAASYSSAITLSTPKGKADAKRIMVIMRLAAKQGTTLTVTCEGSDEDQAHTAMQEFLAANL